MDKISGRIISLALEEDIGKGDVTTSRTVPEGAKAVASITAKSEGVFCGMDVAREILAQVDKSIRFHPFIRDGDKVVPGMRLAEAEGSARSLLTAERTLLNFIQRLSGVATETAKYVREVKGTKVKILDTRKTEPGLRLLQKHAVMCGGGENHRMGLYDMVLIKENHIKASGGIAQAVASAKKSGLRVEVETENLEEVAEAVRAGADVIMFDDMSIDDMKEALRIVNGRAVTEASGGINMGNAAKIAATGVDTMSIGSLTHSYRSLDISMKIKMM